MAVPDAAAIGDEMTTAALVMAYWFLAAPVSSTYHRTTFADSVIIPSSDIARAFGPYPTREMCVQAEHTADNTDKRFWSPELMRKWADYNKAKALYEKDSASVGALLEQLRKANPKTGLYTYHGLKFRVEDYAGMKCYSSSLGYIPCQPQAYAADYDKWIRHQMPTPPESQFAAYTVLDPCQPVKGWYAQEMSR